MIKLHIRVGKEQNAIVVSLEFLSSVYGMSKSKIQHATIISYTEYSETKRPLKT